MAHDVFISYAAEDKFVADAICKALEADGIRCWYAPRDVPYGQDFEEAIVDAICESRLVILIVSSHSNTSAHVKREIQNACAEEARIPVLPFRIHDVPLNKAMRYYIGGVHWLDAVTPPLESHLQSLVDHVHPRLPRRTEPPAAKEPETGRIADPATEPAAPPRERPRPLVSTEPVAPPPELNRPRVPTDQLGPPINPPIKVTNYLVPAILVTVLCCLPGGVASIVFAAQANSKLGAGDIQGAMKASRRAKAFMIVSIVLGLIVYVFYLLVQMRVIR